MDQHLAFLEAQRAFIETQEHMIEYGNIQFRELVPVVSDGDEWVRQILFYVSDAVGAAEWATGATTVLPTVEVGREQKSHLIEMGGIGYAYNMEELAAARRLRQNLNGDRAIAARRVSEEFLDNLALNGREDRPGWDSLLTQPVTTVRGNVGIADGAGKLQLWGDNVAAAGSGANDAAKRMWANKTADQIVADINAILTGVWRDTLQIERADTLLLPLDAFSHLTSTRVPDTAMTIFQYIQQANVFTAATNRRLMIRAVRGLEAMGPANDQHGMIAYKRDPMVLKFHLPMPHRFLDSYRAGDTQYRVPGVFRTGGLEIRKPWAIRYAFGIWG